MKQKDFEAIEVGDLIKIKESRKDLGGMVVQVVTTGVWFSDKNMKLVRKIDKTAEKKEGKYSKEYVLVKQPFINSNWRYPIHKVQIEEVLGINLLT